MINHIQSMMKTVYRILMFQASPEELPFSFSQLMISCFFLLSLLFLLLHFGQNDFISALWKSAIFEIVTGLFILISLQSCSLEGRFVQTLTAIYTCEFFIFLFCLFPYILIMHLLPHIANTFFFGLGMTMASLLIIVASIWLFMLISQILEAALEISMLMSLALSLLFFSLQFLIFSELYF